MPELPNPARTDPVCPAIPPLRSVPAYPANGPVEDHQVMSGDPDVRAQQAMDRGHACQLEETFRDNPVDGRFELLIDGALAAHLTYTVKGEQVVLIDGAEHSGFRDQGMDVTLMRHIVLDAHRRRLSLVPQCPMAFSFLADHPGCPDLDPDPGH
jgi:predicted GNAT family acetyltransferase